MHLYVDFTVPESCRGQLESIQMLLPKEKRLLLPSPDNTGGLLVSNTFTGLAQWRAGKADRRDTVYSML